eukprot:TRINITY_DN64694_c0_g2_i1.p2 TRINITY_DN64694_c0_g2~~TRINITY_DN64694_c0_g2_i1.p2  ORF type:complete len:332 (-),score=-6.95 TRINITY_DN64694_c0_g2_i1:14-1009(-)
MYSKKVYMSMQNVQWRLGQFCFPEDCRCKRERQIFNLMRLNYIRVTRIQQMSNILHIQYIKNLYNLKIYIYLYLFQCKCIKIQIHTNSGGFLCLFREDCWCKRERRIRFDVVFYGDEMLNLILLQLHEYNNNIQQYRCLIYQIIYIYIIQRYIFIYVCRQVCKNRDLYSLVTDRLTFFFCEHNRCRKSYKLEIKLDKYKRSNKQQTNNGQFSNNKHPLFQQSQMSQERVNFLFVMFGIIDKMMLRRKLVDFSQYAIYIFSIFRIQFCWLDFEYVDWMVWFISLQIYRQNLQIRKIDICNIGCFVFGSHFGSWYIIEVGIKHEKQNRQNDNK